MKSIAEFLARWVEFCERRPGRVLLTLGILTLLAGGYAAANFAINSDLEKLIRPAESLRWYRASEVLKTHFPEQQRTSVVVVSGTSAAAVDRTGARLSRALRNQEGIDFVFAPALDDFLRNHRAYFVDSEPLSDWISGVQYDYGALLRLADDADLANLVFTLADQVAATNGLRLPTALKSVAESFQDGIPESIELEAYPHLAPDSDSHYLILVVKGLLQHDEQLPNAEQVAMIRAVIAGSAVDEGVRIRLTGEVPLEHEEISAALDGIGIAGTISLVLLGLILHFGVRSWRIIAAIFLLLGVGVVLTLAFATAAVGSFNTLALIFVIMFFGLGVDFAVHFSLRLREGVVGDSPEDAEMHVAREIGPALVLCMLTSSIAFLSFVPTAYLGLGELGIISAGGMFIAMVLTLTLLPAFFSLFGLPALTAVSSSRSIVRWTPDPVLVVGVAAFLALAALWVARDLEFDYSVLALRDGSTEAMSTLLELQKNGISTDYSIQILAEDGAHARSLAESLEALPETGAVLTPAGLVPGDQAEKARLLSVLPPLLDSIGPLEYSDGTQASDALGAALLYLDETRLEYPNALSSRDRQLVDDFARALSSLGDQPEVLERLNADLRQALAVELHDLRQIAAAEPFTFEQLPEDLQRRFVTSDGAPLITVMPSRVIDTRAATDAFVGAVMSVVPDVGGRAVVEWGVGGVAVESFAQAAFLSVAGISILLVIYFRGLMLPIVVLVPLLLTTVMTFAVIELTGLTLNMANILVVPLIFGLGVDTGIHVVHRFKATGNVSAMLGSSTARAVIISAFTTIGTFFSLSFSPHKGAASVGLLLTVAICIMLAVTLLVVPALLRLQRPGN